MTIHESALVARTRARLPPALRGCGTMMLGLLLATFSVMLPRTAAAQVVRGTVVDAHADTPIMIVNVSILDDGGEVLRTTTSDRNGNFMIGTEQSGAYRLRAERLGYESVTTEPLEFRRDSIVEVVVRMATEAIALDPLEVIGRGESEINRATFEGLYQRRARSPSVGFDRVFVRDDPELDDSMTVREFIRLHAGGPARRSGRLRGCFPNILLRGTELRSQAMVDVVWELRLYELEGIELYRRVENAPPSIRPSSTRCGFAVIWPRQRGDEPW